MKRPQVTGKPDNRQALQPEPVRNRKVHEEDALPNAYTLRCIWFIIILVWIGLALELANFWIVDMDIALPGLLGTLFFLLVAEVLGFIVPHTRPWLKYAIVFLDVAAGTVLGIFMTYHTILFCGHSASDCRAVFQPKGYLRCLRVIHRQHFYRRDSGL